MEPRIYQFTENDFTYSFPDMEPEKRMMELILYIADKLYTDPRFGKVKLAKVLFFADFMAYKVLGKPITGAAYKKLQLGPVPSEFFNLLDEMESSSMIAIQVKNYHGHDQQRVVSLREPDLSLFTGPEVGFMDKIIELLEHDNAAELSAMSHGKAWQSTHMKEPIPYELALLSDRPISVDDLESAGRFAEEQGWVE